MAVEIKKGFHRYTVYPPLTQTYSDMKAYKANGKMSGNYNKENNKCFNCGRKFADDERPYISYILQKGCMFFCETCAAKFNSD